MAKNQTVTLPATDPKKTEEYLGKFFTDLVASITSLNLALGDRLGLFKTLAARGPATAKDLAQRTNVSPRYVLEWARALASAGYLTHNVKTDRFSLEPSWNPILAEEGGPQFFGGFLQQFPVIWERYWDIAKAFKTGKGVAVDSYGPEFYEGQARSAVQYLDHQLVGAWIPAMPHVQSRLKVGASVAEIGSGRGRGLIALAKAFPKSRFFGYDIHGPSVVAANKAARAAGVGDRVSFFERDAVKKGLPEKYDLVLTFDTLHDLGKPGAVVKAVGKALAKDGTFLLYEPCAGETLADNAGLAGSLLYGAGVGYCLSVGLSQGPDALGTAGLPESKVKSLAKDAGLTRVKRLPATDPMYGLWEIRS